MTACRIGQHAVLRAPRRVAEQAFDVSAYHHPPILNSVIVVEVYP